MSIVAVCLVMCLSTSTHGLLNLPCLPRGCVHISCDSPCDGKLVHSGTIANIPQGYSCECCPPCSNIQTIGRRAVGESCADDVDCSPGLHCDLTIHTCVSIVEAQSAGPCANHLQWYLTSKQHMLGSARPTCETDGTYSPKQCTRSGCYCSDPDGNSLGYFTHYGTSTDNMDCECALDKDTYMKTGLVGKLFFCDKKGSYQRIS